MVCGDVRLAYCVEDIEFQLDRFQSQIPYSACTPGAYWVGTALVCGNFRPVPKSIMMRGGPEGCGTLIAATFVVIGCPAAVVISGVLMTAHALSLLLVRSKRHTFPSR